MGLIWSSVRAEHVTKACEMLLVGENRPRSKAKGIFLYDKGQQLPAKHVARLAYCLANKLPLSSQLKFSSGDGVLSLFRKLGFEAVRAAHQVNSAALPKSNE